MGTAVAAAQVAVFVATWIGPAFMVGSAAWGFIASKPKAPSSVIQSGHLVSTRSSMEPIKIVYGTYKVAGNWVYVCPHGINNKFLNIVVCWCEGVVTGLAPAIEDKPEMTGPISSATTPLNDLYTSGTYTGASHAYYEVWITTAGTPDKYKWQVNSGGWSAAADIPTTDTAIGTDGVNIRFGANTGHVLNSKWGFWATNQAVWMGDHLHEYYKHYGAVTPLDLVTHTFYTGTSTQDVDATLKSNCPTWNDAMKNTCYSIFTLTKNENAFPSIPDFFALIKGRKIRNVTDGSWPADTPAYSTNPVNVALDFLTDTRAGFGLSTGLIDVTTWTAAKNWADSEPYAFNGAIIDRQAFLDNFEQLLVNFLGFVIWSDGKYKMKTMDDDASVMTLTTADIEISPESFSISVPGIPETPNKVKAIYSDPYKGYNANWVYNEDTSAITLAGEPREMEIPLIGTTSASQAAWIAQYYRFRNQFNKTFSIIAHPRCFALEPGDMISITHDFPGWTTEKVRVSDVGVTQDGMIALSLLEEDSSIYTGVPDVEPPSPPPGPPPGPSTIPAPQNVTVVNQALYRDYVNQMRYVEADLQFTSGDISYSYVAELRLQTVANTSADCVTLQIPNGTANGSTVSYHFGGMTCATDYKFRVKAIGPNNSYSDWSSDYTFTSTNDTTQPDAVFQFINLGSNWVQVICGDYIATTYYWYYRWGTPITEHGEIFSYDSTTSTYPHTFEYLVTSGSYVATSNVNRIDLPCVFSASTLYVALVGISSDGTLGGPYYDSWSYEPGIAPPPVSEPYTLLDPSSPQWPTGTLHSVLGLSAGYIDVCESAVNWQSDYVAVQAALSANDTRNTDGRLEAWDDEHTLTNWDSALDSGSTIHRDDTSGKPFEGTYCARMDIGTVGANYGAVIWQDITLVASTLYRLTIRFKCTTVGDQIRLMVRDGTDWLHWLDSAGAWQHSETFITLTFAGSGRGYYAYSTEAYDEYELFFTSHADYTDYRIYVLGSTENTTVYVDNYFIKMVVDETAVANSAAANDMTIMGSSPVIDDAYYIGGYDQPFRRFRINIGTAGDGTYNILSEYWNGTLWKSMPNPAWRTILINATGATDYETDEIPTDWTTKTINSVTGYWVRIRVYSFTAQVTQAKGTQAWVEAHAVSTDTTFYRSGHCSIKIIASSQATDKWVKTIDLQKANCRPNTNIVNDGTYFYAGMFGSDDPNEIRFIRYNYASTYNREKRVLASGLLNSQPLYLQYDSDDGMIYCLAVRAQQQWKTGTYKPQIMRIRVADFTMDKVLTCEDSNIGTVSDYKGDSRYISLGITHANFQIQGDYLYFPWLKIASSTSATITLNKVDLNTFTYSECVDTELEVTPSNESINIICDATYLYLFPTNTSTYTKIQRYTLSDLTAAPTASTDDVEPTLYVEDNGTYFFVNNGTTIDRVAYGAYPGLTVVTGPSPSAGFSYDRVWFDRNTTHVYAPTWKDTATAPEIHKILIADWSTNSVKALPNANRGEVMVYVGSTYIDCLSDPWICGASPIDYGARSAYLDRILISDFNTITQTGQFGELDLSTFRDGWISFYLAADVPSKSVGQFKFGMGESAVDDNWAYLNVYARQVKVYRQYLWDMKLNITPISRNAILYFGFMTPAGRGTIWVDPPTYYDYQTQYLQFPSGYKEIATLDQIKKVEDLVTMVAFEDSMETTDNWTSFTGANAGTLTEAYDDTANGAISTRMKTNGAAIDDYLGIYRSAVPSLFTFPFSMPERTYTKLAFRFRFRSENTTDTSGCIILSTVNNQSSVKTGTNVGIYWTTATDGNIYGRSYSTGESVTGALLALDTDYHDYAIYMSSTSVDFYVDGVFIESLTTAANIPINKKLYCLVLVKDLVADPRYIDIDYISVAPEE